MALTLDSLRVLDAIDRKGSFAAAATEMDRVPSALTYLVRKLEDDLDVLLFDRRGHRAKLTAAGQELLREGRHLLYGADELERRVKRVASGWEVELRIAIDGILPIDPLLALARDFYIEEPATRLRISSEVLTGTWDSLVSGRCDLAIGTGGGVANSWAGAGLQSQPLGVFEMVFVVAPFHPLANAVEPIAADELRRHRAVAVADTSRTLPVATVGLLRGQDVLTVPTMEAKIAAQIAGLGCGYVSINLAMPHIAANRLVPKLSSEPRFEGSLFYSWNGSARGKAMRWFLERLESPAVRKSFLP